MLHVSPHKELTGTYPYRKTRTSGKLTIFPVEHFGFATAFRVNIKTDPGGVTIGVTKLQRGCPLPETYDSALQDALQQGFRPRRNTPLQSR